ncbi:unnamed protein product [Adineta ricciae]|uniref:Uncharacterized protein n=1 Tax=Adineta ricciae TaxID=249248 RepID=A0A815UBD6_ADIRI|nr:unnamed protein product [Adineta ricciae]CAF1513938.1 unnamed protein product [Adineta ricciae]
MELFQERTRKELPVSSSFTYVQENEIADQLFNVFESIWAITSYNEENEIQECEIDLDYEAKDEESPVLESFSLSYMKRALDYYDAINPKTGKLSHTWRNVQNKFKTIKDQSYKSRFRDYTEKGRTKKQKVDSADDYVYNNFERARDLLCAVHDIDLKRWAVRRAKMMSLHGFVMSDHRILNFKHEHNICSTKIIKVVTKRDIVNEAEIKKSADQFVSEVKSLLPYYNEDFVLNTDRAGLQLEFPSTRTLSYQGEKTTLATVRSVNATTHSYTVQPTITLSGKIFGPVYICLKEVNGRMSDNIKANLPQLKNVVVTCSASGKLTTSLVEYWRKECLIPSLTSQSVLLLSDSWPGQTSGKGIYESIKGLKRLEIPWKTTSTIQPLDVFFNRQWKVIVRRGSRACSS